MPYVSVDDMPFPEEIDSGGRIKSVSFEDGTTMDTVPVGPRKPAAERKQPKFDPGPLWKKIESIPAFKTASTEKKAKLREMYFEDILAEKYEDEESLEAARAAFMAPVEKEREIDRAVSEGEPSFMRDVVGKTAKDVGRGFQVLGHGVMKGTQSFYDPMRHATNIVSRLTGLEKGGAFDALHQAAAPPAEWAPRTIPEKIVSAVGEAGPMVGNIMGTSTVLPGGMPAVMALHEGLAAADGGMKTGTGGKLAGADSAGVVGDPSSDIDGGGRGGIMEGLKGAAHGALLGGTLKGAEQLNRYISPLVMGGIFGGDTLLQGGSPEDALVNTIVGAGLGIGSGKRPKTLAETINERFATGKATPPELEADTFREKIAPERSQNPWEYAARKMEYEPRIEELRSNPEAMARYREESRREWEAAKQARDAEEAARATQQNELRRLEEEFGKRGIDVVEITKRDRTEPHVRQDVTPEDLVAAFYGRTPQPEPVAPDTRDPLDRARAMLARGDTPEKASDIIEPGVAIGGGRKLSPDLQKMPEVETRAEQVARMEALDARLKALEAEFAGRAKPEAPPERAPDFLETARDRLGGRVTPPLEPESPIVKSRAPEPGPIVPASVTGGGRKISPELQQMPKVETRAAQEARMAELNQKLDRLTRLFERRGQESGEPIGEPAPAENAPRSTTEIARSLDKTDAALDAFSQRATPEPPGPPRTRDPLDKARQVVSRDPAPRPASDTIEPGGPVLGERKMSPGTVAKGKASLPPQGLVGKSPEQRRAEALRSIDEPQADLPRADEPQSKGGLVDSLLRPLRNERGEITIDMGTGKEKKKIYPHVSKGAGGVVRVAYRTDDGKKVASARMLGTTIGDIEVKKKHRGQGIGKAVMQDLVDRGGRGLYAATEAGAGLAKSAGMEAKGGGRFVLPEKKNAPGTSYFHGSKTPDRDIASWKSSSNRKAIYFHADKDLARQYGKHVTEAKLSVEKTFDYERPEHMAELERILKEDKKYESWWDKEIRDGDWEMIEKPAVQKYLKENGYDSYYVNDHPGKALAVFDPKKITKVEGDAKADGSSVKFQAETAPAGEASGPGYSTDSIRKAFNGADVSESGPGAWTVSLPNGKVVNVRHGIVEAPPSMTGGKNVRGAWVDETRTMWLTDRADSKTVNHEAFHAAWDMVLDKPEQASLLRKYKTEEGAAEAYAKWKTRREESRTIFRKIFDTFDAIRKALFKGSSHAAFTRIHSGEVFKRHKTTVGDVGLINFELDKQKWDYPADRKIFGTVNNRLSKELEVFERLFGKSALAVDLPGKLVDNERVPTRTIKAHDLGKELFRMRDNGSLKRFLDPSVSAESLAAERGLSGKEKKAFLKELDELRSGPMYLELTEKGKPILSNNGKAGMSADFLLGTCQPTMPCKECYAASAMVRMSAVKKAFRNTAHILVDPNGWAERVAKEVRSVDKTQLPFVRLLGSGDLTTSEQVTAFNRLAELSDRPIQIFSRHHDNLAKLNGTKDAPFIKMGSIDSQLYDHYGAEFLKENMEKRGIANVWLYTDKAELPKIKDLADDHALALILSADVGLHKDLPATLRMASCPCDAHERSYMASCRQCALGQNGCFMAYAAKGFDSTGKVWDLMDPNKPKDISPFTVFLKGVKEKKGIKPIAQAYSKVAQDIVGKSIELVNLYIREFKAGNKKDIALKDIRFPDDVIRVTSVEAAEAYRDNLKKIKAEAAKGTFELPGGEIQPGVKFEKGQVSKSWMEKIKEKNAEILGSESGQLTLDFRRRRDKYRKDIQGAQALEKVHGMIGEKSPDPRSNWGVFQTRYIDRFDAISREPGKLLNAIDEWGLPAREAHKEALAYSAHKDVTSRMLRDLSKAIPESVKKQSFLFSDYIDAHRALTRAQRGIKNPNGVTLAEAKQAITEAESVFQRKGGKLADLQKAFAEFQRFANENILAAAADAGIISRAAEKAIRKNNEFYATFDILDFQPRDINDIPMLKSREYFSVGNQDIIKGMKGTNRQIKDPVEATIDKFIRLRELTARNKVASALVDDPGFARTLRPVAESAKEFADMKARGLDPVMYNDGVLKTPDFDVINRFKGGEVERYMVDKEIGEAMKQLPHHGINRLVSAIHGVFRKTATTLYIPFTVSNIARDFITGYTTSPVYRGNPIDLMKYGFDVAKGVGKGLAYEFTGKGKSVQDYIEAGGGFGFVGEIRNGKELRTELEKRGIVHYITSPTEILRLPLRGIEHFAAGVELGPRVANYERALQRGATPRDAALIGRSATIDFNKAGIWLRIANQWIPFLNARVQARNNLVRAVRRDIQQGDFTHTIGKVAMTVLMPGLATYLWNKLNHPELLDDIPKTVRDNYFVWITGKGIDKDGRPAPEYVIIPKGDVGQMVMNPLEYAMDTMAGKDREGFSRFATGFLSDLSPVPFADDQGKPSLTRLAGSITPPVIKTPAEPTLNKDLYRGRDIEPSWMQNIRPEYRKFDSTPPEYVALGEKLGISPLKIQNVMGNLFAGMGRHGITGFNAAIKGRFSRIMGGEVERKAWLDVESLEKDYNYARSDAMAAMEQGNRAKANEIMRQWNSEAADRIDAFNSRFSKYGLRDRGGLAEYKFSYRKMLNVLRKRDDAGMPPIEKRLRK